MLARLLDVPRDAEFWQLWGLDHEVSHDAIRTAILAQAGVQLQPQVIYPLPLAQMRVFLAANQQLHLDLEAVLGIFSQDLEDVDLNNKQQLDAWCNIHWQLHNTAENRLGIAT